MTGMAVEWESHSVPVQSYVTCITLAKLELLLLTAEVCAYRITVEESQFSI